MKRSRMAFPVALALAACSPVAAAIIPARLRCEYRVDPLGIDVARPRLSWIVESGRRAERQTAYQVRAAGSQEALQAGQADLWDSGKVISDETAQIPYGGRPLTSGQECWWTVRCWDRDGHPSAFSRPARWTMGLLQPSDWKAQWISLESTPDPSGSDTSIHNPGSRTQSSLVLPRRRSCGRAFGSTSRCGERFSR